MDVETSRVSVSSCTGVSAGSSPSEISIFGGGASGDVPGDNGGGDVGGGDVGGGDVGGGDVGGGVDGAGAVGGAAGSGWPGGGDVGGGDVGGGDEGGGLVGGGGGGKGGLDGGGGGSGGAFGGAGVIVRTPLPIAKSCAFVVASRTHKRCSPTGGAASKTSPPASGPPRCAGSGRPGHCGVERGTKNA